MGVGELKIQDGRWMEEEETLRERDESGGDIEMERWKWRIQEGRELKWRIQGGRELEVEDTGRERVGSGGYSEGESWK